MINRTVRRALVAIALVSALAAAPSAARASVSAHSSSFSASIEVKAKKAKSFTRAPQPAITGSNTVGAVLRVKRGTWKPTPSFRYRWRVNGVTIPGATQSRYTVRASDAGQRISVVVRAKKRGYRTTDRVSGSWQIAFPVQTPAPAPSAPAPAPSTPAPAPAPVISAPVVPAPVTPTPTPAPVSNVAIAGDGDYRVGVTVQPGTYVTTAAATDYCYWKRVRAFDGAFSSIIANDIGNGQRIITISPGDYGVTFTDCGSWVRESDAPHPSRILEGRYLVGSQLATGTYAAYPSTSGCYWALLRSFDGGSSSIITNDYRSQAGVVYVQVGSGARGFESSGCGTWTRIS